MSTSDLEQFTSAALSKQLKFMRVAMEAVTESMMDNAHGVSADDRDDAATVLDAATDTFVRLHSALSTALRIEDEIRRGDIKAATDIALALSGTIPGDTTRSIHFQAGRRQAAGAFIDALTDNPSDVIDLIGA